MVVFYGEPGRYKTITWISAQVFALMRHHKHFHSCTYDLHTHEDLRPDAWACHWRIYGPGGFQRPAQIPRSSLKLSEASWSFQTPSVSRRLPGLPKAPSQRLPSRGSLPEAPKAPKASGDSGNFQTPRDSQRHLYTSLLYFIYILSISYPISYPISYLFFFYILSHLWTGKFDSI